MTAFRVQLTRAAARDLDSVPGPYRGQIAEDLRGLGEAPVGGPPRIKRLRGFAFPLYRLRSGDYRVLYRIDEALVTVLRVVDRRELERVIRRLKLGGGAR